MSEFSFTASAVAVTSHERKSARLEGTYDALVAHLMIDGATSSTDITDAARSIVIEGAHNDGTATGLTVTEDDLTGRDPGADVKTRDYWKAARAVRKGLVSAIARAAGDVEDETPTESVLRVSLSGEGGGSTVVPVDHPMYAAIVALLAGE